MSTIGFIGGSGIYEALLPLNDVREVEYDTPYGEPSDAITIGEFGDTGKEVAFLPRHGSNHGVSPTDLPYRANMYALKKAGVTHIFASNAVGSLKAELEPGTPVVPDQIYDRTKHRDLSFTATASSSTSRSRTRTAPSWSITLPRPRSRPSAATGRVTPPTTRTS